MKKLLRRFFLNLKNPEYTINYIKSNGKFDNLTDRRYLELLFKKNTGYALNLEQPRTFNEKLQWLKLYNRNPLYSNLVDKYEVRKYVTEKIGSQYLNTIYGVYKNFEEINFKELPDQFVLKPTHTSGDYFICKNKNMINYKKLKSDVDRWMERNYFQLHREWPYKNAEPRIISEKLLIQENSEELRDYRLFCFNGEPKFIAVDFSITDKNKTRRNLYDLNWDLMDATISYPRELEIEVEQPEKLDELIEISRKLAKGIPHARIDFYIIKNQIIFGEITFFHQAGMGTIKPHSFDLQMGEWININSKKSIN